MIEYDKKNYKFSVRILGIEPESVYMDKVYTQLVQIEFSNGQRGIVYDNMLCSKDMIGNVKKISLNMLTLSLEKKEFDIPKIILNSSAPIHQIYGCIEELVIPENPLDIEKWYFAVVDFSIGKVLINIDKKYFHLYLKNGDTIHVTGRLDLKEI